MWQLDCECGEGWQVEWEHLGVILQCDCGNKYEVCYEENMDSDYYFYLEEIVEG